MSQHSTTTVRVPPDLSGRIREIGDTYVASGGFSDIWRGQWIIPPIPSREREMLAIKAFKGSRIPSQAEKLQRRLRRETRHWLLLNHENILPLYGVCYQRVGNITDFPVLIAPYLRNGSIMQYIQRNPIIDRLPLLRQAAAGLQHLHRNNFVHGDLKGANVLIRDDGKACLCDFGRTSIINDDDYSRSLVVSARWTAPELIQDTPEDGSSPIPVTFASDIWAYGMVVLEVITGALPYGSNLSDFAILRRLVLHQGRPQRTEYASVRADIWNAIEPCWDEPNVRPSIAKVLDDLPEV